MASYLKLRRKIDIYLFTWGLCKKNYFVKMMQDLQRFRNYVEKENILRLKWFKKNECKLEWLATRPNLRTLSPETLQKQENIYKELLHQERLLKKKPDEVIPEYEGAEESIMKATDPKTREILYKGGGRLKYLHERIKLKPEERYYFPEVTSFQYGWKMWKYSIENPIARYGKSKIVRTSFYRRRGTERDPDWYKECSKISKSPCGGI